jgi:hypothetical protein
MKAKKDNNLIGRKVLIDWPVRWREACPNHRDELKAKAKASESYFGHRGEIVAYDPNEERAKCLKILLEGAGQFETDEEIAKARLYAGVLINLYEGAVTITSDPINPESELLKAAQETNRTLDAIRRTLEILASRSSIH